MRSCDGIFSVNWGGALLAQQELGSQVRSPDPQKMEESAEARPAARHATSHTDARQKKSTTGFRGALANFFWR
jgi:hypothetical protein